MPRVEGAPIMMNALMEKVYSGCMDRMDNATRCSKIAWDVVKQHWFKDKDGKWKKRKDVKKKD